MSAPHDVLVQSRLLQHVPTETIAGLLRHGTVREWPSGATMLEAGTVNRVLFVLLHGRADVHIPGSGDAGAHTTLGPGDCFGELSLIDDERTAARIVAAEPAAALVLDADQLWAAVEAAPQIARNLLAILTRHVRHDDEVLAERARLQQHFQRAATVDGLTGLRNRRWLDDAFARQLSRSLRDGQPVSLLMIDLDDFKGLNDRHGHMVGDAVLCRVAQVLAGNLRPDDLLARYGGDEFALLLPHTDTADATAIAGRLQDHLAAANREPSHEPLPPTTLSIGVATARISDALGALVSLADAALYRAKAAGRNRVSR